MQGMDAGTHIPGHGDRSRRHLYRYSRLEINRMGLWLFILSESMLFLGLLAARFTLQGTAIPDQLSQVIGLVITAILLISSFTAYRAETAFANGDEGRAIAALRLTLILGGVFVLGVAFEWSAALSHFPPRTGFGTVFFTMTGIHAFHVVTGLIFIAIVHARARAGSYREDRWPVEAAVKYWHFVDVVWVFFYPALYLIGSA